MKTDWRTEAAGEPEQNPRVSPLSRARGAELQAHRPPSSAFPYKDTDTQTRRRQGHSVRRHGSCLQQVLPAPAGLRPALGLRGWVSAAFLEGTEIGFSKTMKGQPTHLSICPFSFPKPYPRGLSEIVVFLLS